MQEVSVGCSQSKSAYNLGRVNHCASKDDFEMCGGRLWGNCRWIGDLETFSAARLAAFRKENRESRECVVRANMAYR